MCFPQIPQLNLLCPPQPDCTARCRPTTASHAGRRRPSNSNRTRAPFMTSTWTRSWRWTWTRRPWRPCLARTWPVTLTFWECGSRRYWTGQHGCVWLYAMARGLSSPSCSLNTPIPKHTLTSHSDLITPTFLTWKPTHSFFFQFLAWNDWTLYK